MLNDFVGGAMYLHKQRVYGLLRAKYVAMFHCVFAGKFGFLAHISKTTWARDLQNFLAAVQRPYLIMVALSQRFCAQYVAMDGHI